MPQNASYNAVQWDTDTLVLLDQRLLPKQLSYIRYQDAAAVANAIRDMVVRGAPAIGICAAYAVVLSALQHISAGADWRQAVLKDIDTLRQARPTAVNLAWALEKMSQLLDQPMTDPLAQLLLAAKAIHQEDIEANAQMARFGADLIEPGKQVITHCNTGPLATGGIGTALGVIQQAYRDKRISGVFADETRPWMQGARLTSWELQQNQIPVTVICDSAAAYVMSKGDISWAIVGADRITANGDVVNKIGTYNLAIAAKYHGVKFMAVAPMSTVDMDTASGRDVEIEQRPASEVTHIQGQLFTPEQVGVMNPAFDVTPAALVDAIVTERGVVQAPSREKMLKLLNK